jgi:hypothetical protein
VPGLLAAIIDAAGERSACCSLRFPLRAPLKLFLAFFLLGELALPLGVRLWASSCHESITVCVEVSGP